MSDFNYTINPCYACHNKFKRQSSTPDVNEINSCCSEVLGAFEGNVSINAYRNSLAARNCRECVRNSILGMGRTPCDLRLTMAPNFAQVPHYFPQIFNEVKDIDQARQMCVQKCQSSPYPNTCVEQCNTDSTAVVMLNGQNANETARMMRKNKEYYSGVF